VNFDQPAEITGFESVADRNPSIEEPWRNGARSHERGVRR
jgi:hypothetical protein